VVALFMTGIAVSNVIGSPLSGAILQYAEGAGSLRGWEWLFLIEAAPSIVLGLLFLALLPDGPRQARWLSDAQRALVAERLAGDEAAKVSGRHTVGATFADLRVWAFAAVYFCTIVCLYAVNFWMPTMVQEMGIDTADYLRVGLVSMIPWGFMIVAQVAWARHSDRTGERRWHVALGLMVALAGLVTLAVASHSVALSMVGLTLVTVGTGCAVVTFWSLPPMILSGVAAAAGIAWINSVGNLGWPVRDPT
jgi:MFS family permease